MARTGYYDVLNGVTSVPAGLLQALEERGSYVIKDGETPSSLTPGNVLYLIYQNVMFWYDPADSVTAGDNTTCIVTSDGKRFKSSGFQGNASRITPVINRTTTTPPASPSNGDTYLVAASATGAWAGKDKNIASYTARGWVFLAPNTYDIVYSVADAGYYFYNASAVWTSGLPAITIGDSTISPIKFKYAKFGLGVVNQTTNTPPTSPTDGDAYIIGTSPTGVWSGNARKIAIYETSAWVIYTPQDGWMVFDKAQFASFTYYSGVWNSLASGIASEKLYTAVGSTALTRTNATATSFAGDTSTTAPTTARVYFDSSISITHQCGSNKTLEFSFTSGGQFVSGTGLAYGFTIGLHVDSSATATDWAYQPAINLTSSTATPYVSSVVLKHVTADTSSHTYKLIFYPYHTSSGTSATFTTVWNLYTPRLVMRQLA